MNGKEKYSARQKEEARDRDNALALAISLYCKDNQGIHRVDDLKTLATSYKLYLRGIKLAVELGFIKKLRVVKGVAYCHADYHTQVSEKLKLDLEKAKEEKKPFTAHIQVKPKPKKKPNGYLSPESFADKLCEEMKAGEFLTRKIHLENCKNKGLKKPATFTNILRQIEGRRRRLITTKFGNTKVLHIEGDETFIPAMMELHEADKKQRKEKYRKTIAKEKVEEEIPDSDFSYSDYLAKALTIPQFVGESMWSACR